MDKVRADPGDLYLCEFVKVSIPVDKVRAKALPGHPNLVDLVEFQSPWIRFARVNLNATTSVDMFQSPWIRFAQRSCERL